MDHDEYTIESLIDNPWPKWEPTNEGGWVRSWSFRFDCELRDEAVTSDGLGDASLHVLLSRGSSSTELVALTTTHANPWSDECFFFVFFRLFQQLEARFGRLELIQGQARVFWRPFRTHLAAR
jgi:hypothetical protein